MAKDLTSNVPSTPPPPKDKSLPATTTQQEDVTAVGRRRINLIWEMTQAVIAIMITSAVIWNAVNSIDSPILSNAFFLLVSMYYVRTNHTKVGGVPNATSNITNER